MGHVSFIAEMGSVLSTMVRKPEENMPLGRHRLRWDGTVKIILSEGVGCHFVVYLTLCSSADWVVMNDMMIDE
jgi:hypothetical protein